MNGFSTCYLYINAYEARFWRKFRMRVLHFRMLPLRKFSTCWSIISQSSMWLQIAIKRTKLKVQNVLIRSKIFELSNVTLFPKPGHINSHKFMCNQCGWQNDTFRDEVMVYIPLFLLAQLYNILLTAHLFCAT